MNKDFDIVIHTLQEKYDTLWKMTERNMNSEYIGMGIMDDIRLTQMEQLKEAIQVWKSVKYKPNPGYSDIVSDGGMDPR